MRLSLRVEFGPFDFHFETGVRVERFAETDAKGAGAQQPSYLVWFEGRAPSDYLGRFPGGG